MLKKIKGKTTHSKMETDSFSQEQTSSSKTPEKRLENRPDVNWSEYAMDEAITTVVSNALPINALSTNASLALKSKRKSNKTKKLVDNIVIDTEPNASMAVIPSLFEGQVPPDVVVVSSWNQEVEVVTSDPSDWGKVGEQMVSMSEEGRNLESPVKDTSTINTDELNSGRKSHWTIDDMANAINAVKNAKMSVSMAASFYRVPFWSLRDRLRGKVKIAGNTSVELPKPRKKNSRWTSWTQKDLEKAISDVKEGGMSVRKAALLHGIPKSSLGDRLTGKRQVNPTEDSYENETVALTQLDLQGSPSFIGGKKGKKKLKMKPPVGDVTEMPDVTVLSPSLDLVHQNPFFATELPDGENRGELESPVQVHIVHEYNEADGTAMGLFENQGFVALNERTNEKDAKEEKEENTDSQRFDLEQNESKVSLENQNIGYENGNGAAERDERVSGIGMKSAKKRKREEWQGRITMTNDVIGGKSSLKTRIKGWEQKDMENAIRDVTEKGVSIRKAAVTYGIPKSSLGDRLTRIKYIADFGSLFDELKPLNVEKEEILKDLENGKMTPKAMAKHFGISFSRFKGIIANKNITEEDIVVNRIAGKDDGKAGELANSLEERGDNICREEDSPIEVGKGQSNLTLKAKGESSKQLLDRKIKKERMCWERANLELAIEAVREGRLSLRGAAKSYGIPKSTLGDVLRGKSSVGQTPGPKRLLTEEEENSLAGWLITMGRSGRHVKINEILGTVKAILDKSGKSVPRLKNNLPKQSWWYGFLLRHKEVAKVRNQLKEEGSRKIGAHLNLQQPQAQESLGKNASSTNPSKRAVRLDLFTSDAKLSPSKGMKERAEGNDNICSICSKAELSVAGEEIWISCGTVKDDGSLKDGCGGWSHLDCSNLGQSNLTVNELERVTWHCPKCV